MTYIGWLTVAAGGFLLLAGSFWIDNRTRKRRERDEEMLRSVQRLNDWRRE